MAEVAVHGSLSSNSLPFERTASKVQASSKRKRQTPTELRADRLREDLLKHSCASAMKEPPSSLVASTNETGDVVRHTKKPETKNPRFTRVDEVYPARKSSNRSTLINQKEKIKDTFSTDQSISLKNPSLTCKLDAGSETLIACPERPILSGSFTKASMARACPLTEKCSQKTFRSVAEISLGSEKLSGAAFNMAALKTLGARESSGNSHLPKESTERSGDPSSVYTGSFSNEFQISGRKAPLDLTLKTTMRLVSSASVNWCHRIAMSSNHSAINQLTSQFNSCGDQKNCPASGFNGSAKDLFRKSLYSWVYPQSSLPPAVISALNLSAGPGEVDFLLKRQEFWEDSFRSIYYMLRKKICNLFYVCTTQFVVMFTGGDCLGKTKRVCNAYISQSTKGLRSLLREHDVPFSMPLCHSQAEHATAEDLRELFEIGKHNLSQTRRVDSVSDVDNCPESLLAFIGNESVHGLYDFLLNYRSFLSTLVGVDVPVLYAPVPFQNASASVPEVKCKEMKRASSVPSIGRGSHMADGELCQDSSFGVSYSIEIKDTVLPPWTISGICSSMGSDRRCFEASFISDPVSLGLNVALENICQKADTDADLKKGLLESNQTFGVAEAVVAPCLRGGSLRGLKYSDSSYTAYASPL